MSAETQNLLITDLAREQVAHLAPDEMPLFRSTSDAFFQDPTKVIGARPGGDDLLGFGAAEALTFLTPIILAMASDVVQYLVDALGKTLKDEGTGAVQEMIRNLFKPLRPQSTPPPASPSPPPLSPQQLAQIRQLALEKAHQLKVPSAQAALLADSLVGSLVVAA